MCYINGILSSAVQYPDDDDFSQVNPVGIRPITAAIIARLTNMTNMETRQKYCDKALLIKITEIYHTTELIISVWNTMATN